MKILKAFAVLFGLLGVMNVFKVLQLEPHHGLVFFGRRLSGVPNMIAAPVFGAFLLAYASALWNSRSYALPMGLAYACYVTANLWLFNLRIPELTTPVLLYGPLYIAVALAAAWGAVAAMVRNQVGTSEDRDLIVLRMFALMFALMALSDVLKPFAWHSNVGFVLLGHRLKGTANMIVAPLFACFLATYAYSIWTQHRRAFPLGIVYAVYVAANLLLWNSNKPPGTVTPMLFGILYMTTALGVSGGAAWLLYRRREPPAT